jgi:DNA primase catalytic core
MMGRLAEEVLRRADIVEVVSSYIPLKKRGANYWALSPFKPEKTPSFAVSPSKQIFKCFSSGKGGNVIRFVMEMEGISYGEALRKLAERYGIPVTEEFERGGGKSARERYLSIYREVVRFYREALHQSPEALNYLKRRGLRGETLKKFLLGYAPAGWDTLTKRLLGLGYEEETLVEAGVVSRSEETGRLYDRFRHRIIFPIQDERGEVIALAGRTLSEDPQEPKYLNSPETAFYKKSEVLYGFFQAKGAIRKADRVIVVEGYMDCLRLHQEGIEEVVAVSGTALSEVQVYVLRRHARRMYLAFDADTAGEMAAERNIEPALAGGFLVYVVRFEGGKDPDEYVQKVGAEGFRQAVEGAISWVRFLVERIGVDQTEKRYVLYERLGQLLLRVPDPFLRRAYADEIQRLVGIEPSFWESFGGVTRGEGHLRRASGGEKLRADSELLRLWVSYPYYEYRGRPLWEVVREAVGGMTFSEPNLEALRQALMELPWEEGGLEGALLLERLREEVRDLAAAFMVRRLNLSENWKQWDDTPLEEDPGEVFETNYRRLALDHIQKLLEENQQILSSLSPEVPAYREHLELHRVLLEKRREIAERDGIILPYRLREV